MDDIDYTIDYAAQRCWNEEAAAVIRHERPWLPGSGSHYCIYCVALTVYDCCTNGSDYWPPSLEGVPIPVEDLARPFSLLGGELASVVDRYRDANRYRHITDPYNRIFCPHRRLSGSGLQASNGVGLQEFCNTYIAPRVPFEEGQPHVWENCPTCARLVCLRCAQGDPESAR